MIGFIQGKVLHSDGREVILLTNSGIGYQIQFSGIISQGQECGIYVSHILRENLEDLYGFQKIRDKKIFEHLIKVTGVGPKSAFSLISSLGADSICEAIVLENKKILQSAPGIGPKAASQIILDLKKKMQEMILEQEAEVAQPLFATIPDSSSAPKSDDVAIRANNQLLRDSLMACAELGFKEEDVMPLLRKHVASDNVRKPEDLIKLVLKEFGQ